MSSRVSAEIMAGFLLGNFDKGGQAGLSRVGRVKGGRKFLIKGPH